MGRKAKSSTAPHKKSSTTKKTIKMEATVRPRKKKTNNGGSNGGSAAAQWTDPSQRGIHTDAIVAGTAPSSASACVACQRKIPKGHTRWGIKYAGNPLPIPVLPLYGSHPMVMWCCHGGRTKTCGLAFARYADMSSAPPATRTCHACQDAPDDPSSSDAAGSIRLVCGGPPKGRKIRHHVFHIACWIRSVRGAGGDPMVKPQDIAGVPTRGQHGLSWEDLIPGEQKIVCDEFRQMGAPT